MINQEKGHVCLYLVCYRDYMFHYHFKLITDIQLKPIPLCALPYPLHLINFPFVNSISFSKDIPYIITVNMK